MHKNAECAPYPLQDGRGGVQGYAYIPGVETDTNMYLMAAAGFRLDSQLSAPRTAATSRAGPHSRNHQVHICIRPVYICTYIYIYTYVFKCIYIYISLRSRRQRR